MLIIVVVGLERTESNIEFNWSIGLKDRAFWENLEDSHVLSIQILLLLSNPAEVEFALQFVGYFDLSLPTQGHDVTKSEIKTVIRDADELVSIILQKQLLLKDVRMFPNLNISLVEVLLIASIFLTAPLGKFKQNIIFNILEFDSWYPAFDDSLPERIDVDLQKRNWANEQIIAGANQIDVEKQVVPHQAVDSLIVSYRIPRSELNDDLLVGVLGQCAFDIVEEEDVIGIREELKIRI